jgi:ABC-type nitrate/sulfonate/bicarbonate transport system substrate-binding protein
MTGSKTDAGNDDKVIQRILRRKMSRRAAMSTAAKTGVAAGVAAVVAGVGGYFGGAATSGGRPTQTITSTVTQTGAGTTQTVTQTQTQTQTQTATQTVTVSPTLEQPSPFRVAYEPFLSGFIVNIIRQNQWDTQSGLNIEWVEFPNPDEMNTAMGAGQLEVEIPFNVASMAEIVGAGRPVVGTGSSLRGLSSILVKADSPYQSLADLAGKKYGVLDSPDDVSGWLEYGGLPNVERIASEVVNAPPPVLPELLANGDVDSISIFDPFVSLLLATGQARELANVNEVWRNKVGEDLVFTTTAVQRSVADQYPDAIRTLLALWDRGVTWVKDNPGEAMQQYAAGAGLPASPEAIDIYKRRIIPIYMPQRVASVPSMILSIQVIKDLGILSGTVSTDPGMFRRDLLP